jgi:hypothetical protein
MSVALAILFGVFCFPGLQLFDKIFLEIEARLKFLFHEFEMGGKFIGIKIEGGLTALSDGKWV